jgi:RNA polymerase sigma-70 factor (ECF subfamily)
MSFAAAIPWTSIGFSSPEKPERVQRREIRPASSPKAAATETLPRPLKTRAAREERQPSMELDWSAVVRRCLQGDSLAWNELVRSHHRRIYGLCYRFTNNPTDAEDLTQEVFLKVYGNLKSYDDGRGSFQVWITTLTRNLLVDHFRRTRGQRVTDSLDQGWDESSELSPIDRLEDGGRSPLEHAAQKQLEKMVQTALGRLSPELREAVILRDLQDLDYKEIAQVLSIPEGTVKSRISRGRAELARLLEQNPRQVM